MRDYRNKQLNDPPPYNWVTGTYYTGLVAMYETTSDEEYLNQCLKWGKSCNWEIPDKTEQEWDSGFYSLVCGQIWYACYQAVHDESMLSPTFGYLENPNRPNPISAPSEWYLENCGLRFVDGLFTSPPLFAMLYQLTGEEKYIRWMDACFWDTSEPLYDERGCFIGTLLTEKGITIISKTDPIWPLTEPKAPLRNKLQGMERKCSGHVEMDGFLVGWLGFSHICQRIILVTNGIRHYIYKWLVP